MVVELSSSIPTLRGSPQIPGLVPVLVLFGWIVLLNLDGIAAAVTEGVLDANVTIVRSYNVTLAKKLVPAP